MRILIDTNILFSALLFPLSKPAKALRKASDEHSVIFCNQNLYELKEILKRKAPDLLPEAEAFLAEFQYELIPAVDNAEKLIRDAADQPILNAAIISDVDLIITGDKDFLSLNIERPRCITAPDFLEEF